MIAVDYCYRNFKLELKSVLSCLLICVIPEEYHVSVFFTMKDMKFLCSVVCTIKVCPKLCFRLLEA